MNSGELESIFVYVFSQLYKRLSVGMSVHCTKGQNQDIFRHRIIHFPMSEGVSEVSEQANE